MSNARKHDKHRQKKSVRRRSGNILSKITPNMYMAFFLPALVVLIAYISLGVYPFGDKTTMIIDSYHQYVPFFSELHYKIWHGESLLYSWHGSLGYNFIAIMAYYLASPLNILIAIFPSGMMISAFETLILLKIAIASLTAYLLLRDRTGKDDLMIVLMGSFYALGGFNLAYNWNVMWLDSIAIFPLVVMGAEKLIRKGDGRLYTIALGLAIICNYYMAIMICIFLVLYFFVVWFSEKHEDGRSFFRCGVHYAVCSLLGGGLGAFYLLPTYFVLSNSSQGSAPDELEIYRSFWDVFKQMFVFLEPTELDGAPNLYCGILIALLVPVFVFSRRIALRRKITYMALTAFVLISFNINYLDYVWHGFHFPNNLPGRFSFIFILLMVMMAADAYASLETVRLRGLLLAFGAELIVLGFTLFFQQETVENYSIGFTIGFIVVYMLLIFAYKKNFSLKISTLNIRPAQVLTFLLTLELGANAIYAFHLNGTTTWSLYTSDKAEVAELRDEYASSDDFYRMEVGQTRGRDDVIWQNMNGLSFFSSTADDRLEKLMGALGFYNSGNKYTYKGSTPLTDAMMAIRYVFSDHQIEASNWTLAQETEDKYVYTNTQPLSLGYMVSANILDWNIIDGMPFAIQNDFADLAADACGPLFTQLTLPEPELTGATVTSTEDNRWYYDRNTSGASMNFQLFFDDAQDVYIYFEAAHCEELNVYIDGEKSNYTDQRGHIVHIGQVDAASVVSLEFVMDDSYYSGNVALQMYAFDQSVFDQVYANLADEQLQVTSYDSTHVTGTITANEDGIMLLSIPYDEGWTITVDGEKVEQTPVGEALTGINVFAGQHTITMKYMPQGFLPGVAISIASVIICIILLIFKKKSETVK